MHSTSNKKYLKGNNTNNTYIVVIVNSQLCFEGAHDFFFFSVNLI